ncbi:ABC transporter permease [Planctomyces sp. SH-PL14]|uniref:ABC transporter permease n=1 Tax=Planctomyces sp. SH-PL14 TaxID=1632864 RepID=UPI00078E4F79|nr:ABC transporter permease [Planctomyces sp. SH-PL14]AMV17563.1 Ribose transport system permease protein RbsC [Planctomyces sp. SH-PL14]
MSEAPSTPPAGSPRARRGWLLRTHEWALIASILAVIAATAMADSNHAYLRKPQQCLKDNLRNLAPIGMLALGATVVIIAGGIDLSLGSTAAFCATICISLMIVLSPEGTFGVGKPLATWVVVVSCLGSMLAGLMVGTLHTWLIVALRLPPFIVTLGTLVGLRSFARAITSWVTRNYRGGGTGSEEIQFNEPFIEYLDSNVWISVTVLLVLALVIWVVLSSTVLGRHVYALGGNEQASILSGIRTNNVKWFAYAFSGLAASLAGVFYIAKQHSLSPTTMAGGHELNAIAAAVVGGCSLQGGVGTVIGTVLGAVFLQAVVDAVQRIVKTNSNMYEGMIVGIVVVLAVTVSQLDQIFRGRRLFDGKLGLMAIPILSVVAGVLALVTAGERIGIIAGGVVLVLLTAVRVLESIRSRASG